MENRGYGVCCIISGRIYIQEKQGHCNNQDVADGACHLGAAGLQLLSEMNALETREAKIYKALDKLEAVIQHNESDLSTWLPLEYDLQLQYGEENVQFSPYLQALKQQINACTKQKIADGK